MKKYVISVVPVSGDPVTYCDVPFSQVALILSLIYDEHGPDCSIMIVPHDSVSEDSADE